MQHHPRALLLLLLYKKYNLTSFEIIVVGFFLCNIIQMQSFFFFFFFWNFIQKHNLIGFEVILLGFWVFILIFWFIKEFKDSYCYFYLTWFYGGLNKNVWIILQSYLDLRNSRSISKVVATWKIKICDNISMETSSTSKFAHQFRK